MAVVTPREITAWVGAVVSAAAGITGGSVLKSDNAVAIEVLQDMATNYAIELEECRNGSIDRTDPNP